MKPTKNAFHEQIADKRRQVNTARFRYRVQRRVQVRGDFRPYVFQRLQNALLLHLPPRLLLTRRSSENKKAPQGGRGHYGPVPAPIGGVSVAAGAGVEFFSNQISAFVAPRLGHPLLSHRCTADLVTPISRAARLTLPAKCLSTNSLGSMPT